MPHGPRQYGLNQRFNGIHWGIRWRALKMLHSRYLTTEHGSCLFLAECLTWVGRWPHGNVLLTRGGPLVALGSIDKVLERYDKALESLPVDQCALV